MLGGCCTSRNSQAITQDVGDLDDFAADVSNNPAHTLQPTRLIRQQVFDGEHVLGIECFEGGVAQSNLGDGCFKGGLAQKFNQFAFVVIGCRFVFDLVKALSPSTQHLFGIIETLGGISA